jgi:hypothetical protein
LTPSADPASVCGDERLGKQHPVSPGLFVEIGLRHDNPITEARKPPKNQASGVLFGFRSFRVVPRSAFGYFACRTKTSGQH